MLQTEASVSLSVCEANRFAVQPFDEEETSERDPYLLRGVYHLNPRDFSAGESGADVQVSNVGLAKATPPLRRWPVVAFLSVEPERVFVSAAVAE